VAKVWATRVFNLETGKDSVALLGPNIHRAILWVGYDRRIAGRARGFDVFDDRAKMKRQQLLIIGSDSRVARFGPTTPKQADPRVLRSIRPTRATERKCSSAAAGRGAWPLGKPTCRRGQVQRLVRRAATAALSVARKPRQD
jgi:hypothetical protein